LLVVVLLADVLLVVVLLVGVLEIDVTVVPFVSEEFWTDSVLETVSLSERTPTVTPPEAAAVTRKTAKTTEMKARLRIALTPRTIGVRSRVSVVAFRSGRLFVAVGSPRDSVVRRFGTGLNVGTLRVHGFTSGVGVVSLAR
ncbi:hypothetical protein, partial [Halorubrum sp. SS7]|uniref:hypothetical protein n=1 Tax=Halorubrum sp. SS7 TaxID=2518119 RepID=UPI0018EE8204